MRFYGMDYWQTMDTPIKAFWKLFEKISQIEAEEDLRALKVETASSSGDQAKRTASDLQAKMGRPVIVESEGDHSKGFAQLKALKNNS